MGFDPMHVTPWQLHHQRLPASWTFAVDCVLQEVTTRAYSYHQRLVWQASPVPAPEMRKTDPLHRKFRMRAGCVWILIPQQDNKVGPL